MEIPEDKLYRIVKLPNGQFQGEYRIYWNKHIWSLLEENRNIYIWGKIECLKAEPGDWVETYDGTVIQILDIRIYKDKKKRTFHYFRFPTATVYSWTNYKNITKFRQFQGNFMTAGRHSMKMTTVPGHHNQKIRFASLIVAGLNPMKAYRLAVDNKAPMTSTTIHRKINQLMTDEVVKKEVFAQLQPITEKLGETFSDARLVNELDQLLERSRKGSDAHRENIKFIMALLNKLPNAMYPGAKKDKALAVEAHYEEMQPPKLGDGKKESP